MSDGLRILVVEDDPAIRHLLRATLTRAGHAVSDAGSAREAMVLLAGERPDVVLLDLGLPDRDGLELIQLVKTRSEAVLLVVSARTDTAEKVTALDLGADDYILKPFDTEELLARIRTALRHRRIGSAAEAELSVGAITIDLVRHRVIRSGEAIHLTPKEFAVLAMLARQPDHVVGHARILRTVWGPAQERHLEYLRLVIRALRRKLEEDPARPQLILNELGVGYRLTTQ